MTGRTLIALRIGTAGLAKIDKLAVNEGLNRSAMIRRLLSEAVTSREQEAERQKPPPLKRR